MAAAARTALVTGAGQGLGRAIAAALVAEGHRVAFADIDGERAARAAAEFGDKALAVTVDVRDRASVEAAAAEVTSRFGPIGILVNNAARTVARPFFELTEEEWDDVLTTNLRGMVLTCQTILPGMVEAGWGRVINLASLAGQRGGPQVQGAHYASAKAGIIGLTRYLAHEFAPHGITVNAISPGPILTEATALAPPDKLKAVSSQVPLARLGAAEEVGALAAYLASPLSGFVTGATLDINGGLLMR